MTFIIKHLNVNFDRLMANCFPSRAAYKFPAADDVDDLWRGKCAAPSTNSNEPSNGQSSVFGLFIFFYFALLSLSPFIWLNRSPPELVMMSYRIDKGRHGCQVGFGRGCALTEMLRGALKISYFEKREMIVCVYPLNDKYGYVCRLIYETISRWKLFIRVFG